MTLYSKSRLRRPPWQRRIRSKEKKSVPGGEWKFVHRGKEYCLSGRYVQDAEHFADDGLRWIASRESRAVLSRIVYELAQGQCEMKHEGCWGWAPFGIGHTHHIRHKKMGGAFTDDRIWILVDGELQQIRIWVCPTCHRKHHNKLEWSEK